MHEAESKVIAWCRACPADEQKIIIRYNSTRRTGFKKIPTTGVKGKKQAVLFGSSQAGYGKRKPTGKSEAARSSNADLVFSALVSVLHIRLPIQERPAKLRRSSRASCPSIACNTRSQSRKVKSLRPTPADTKPRADFRGWHACVEQPGCHESESCYLKRVLHHAAVRHEHFAGDVGSHKLQTREGFRKRVPLRPPKNAPKDAYSLATVAVSLYGSFVASAEWFRGVRGGNGLEVVPR
eukprot:6200065-Pleurochrysis_carterae.AAC.1